MLLRQVHLTLAVPILFILLSVESSRLGDSGANSLPPNGENVCSVTKSKATSYSDSYSQSYSRKTKTRCGLFGWGRCTKYVRSYRTRYRTAYRTDYYQEYFCCDGFYQDRDQCLDPCKSYVTLQQPWRSMYLKRDPMEPAYCDNGLDNGWYRLDSDAGGDIPVTCVEPSFCSTDMPIWLHDFRPTVDELIAPKTVCVTTSNDTCCGESWNIDAKNCSEFNVYSLVPPPRCNMVYCEGEEPICYTNGDNEEEECVEMFPIMQGPPVLEGPILTHGTFHFKCTVDLADQNDQAARFEVSWLFDGETHDDIESVILHVNSESLSTIIPGEVFSYNKGRLGVMVGCRARSFYENLHKSHWYTSENYFVGIKVDADDPLLLSESDGRGTIIPIWSTIPVLCEDLTYMTACRINILAWTQGEETEDDYFHDELSFDRCDIAIAPRDWNQTSKTATTEFTIVARRDFMDDGVRNVTIRSRVLPPDCVNSSYVSIFDGYDIGPIKVSVIGVDHKRCSSFGDPHYRTLDGLWYTMLKTGYFVLLRGTTDAGRVLEVQTAVTDCAEVSCNCAVAIRENNDLVIMDICNRDSLRISVPRKNLSPGTAIHQQYGNKHYVYMYSGVTLEIRLVSSAQGKWLDVFVVLPSDYSGRTMALCGDGDDDDSNDFTKSNGEITDLNDFAESWRVSEEENLFLKYDQLSWIPERNTMYCNCPTGIDSSRICCGYGLHTDQLRLGTDMTHLYATGTTDQSERSCFDPLDGSVAIHAVTPQCTEKTDQENAGDDHAEAAGNIQFEYDSEFEPSIPEWPTPSGITEGMARVFCGEFLCSASIYNVCIEKTNLNTQKYNETCVTDIQATDTLDFAPSTAAAFQFDCMDLVLRNISLYEDDGHGNKVPPQELVAMLCPNDCSKHGECIDNICLCDEGFTGNDCSHDEGQPIYLSHLKHDALCDLQSRPCETAFGVGTKFVESERLMCKVKLTSQNNHISVYYTEAYLISSTEIACPLKHTGINTYPATVTNNELPVEYSDISVSLDGVTISNELLFTVFDSMCVECTESGNCDKKADSCLIDGMCFAEGNQHRLEPGKYCNPANDEFGWTEKDIIWTTDSANWTEPTIISPGESSAPNSSGGWQIFLGFVGGVLFGAAAIYLVFCILRRRANKDNLEGHLNRADSNHYNTDETYENVVHENVSMELQSPAEIYEDIENHISMKVEGVTHQNESYTDLVDFQEPKYEELQRKRRPVVGNRNA